MDELYAIRFSDEHLAHYGVKGMKWGEHIFETEYEGTGRESGGNTDSGNETHKSALFGPERTESDWTSRVPEAERRKLKENSEKLKKIKSQLFAIRNKKSVHSKKDKADFYNSKEVQTLLDEYEKLIDVRYNMMEAEAKSGVIPSSVLPNQNPPYFNDARMAEHAYFEDWVADTFFGGDTEFFEKVKEQNNLKKEKEQLDNTLSSMFDTIGKIPSDAKEIVFQADYIQEAIHRYYDILNSEYDFKLELLKDEGASPKEIESSENVRNSQRLKFDIALATAFFDGNYDAFEKELKKLDRKQKRSDRFNEFKDNAGDRINEFKDNVGDLVSSLKDKIDDSKLVDEVEDIIGSLKEKLKHEDSEESSIAQSEIIPFYGDSYVIHFSGEDYLAHEGVKRRSGRYPWGSGERPYQGESVAFQNRAAAGKISKYEKKQMKEEAKAQVARVKAAAAAAKEERKAVERAGKATEAAGKQMERDFQRQQAQTEAMEKLKDKTSKETVKEIGSISGQRLTPAQQARVALLNAGSMSSKDLKEVYDSIDYQRKLAEIAASEKTAGQRVLEGLKNAAFGVLVGQVAPAVATGLSNAVIKKVNESGDLNIPEIKFNPDGGKKK